MEITYIPRIVFELKYDFMLDFAQNYRTLLGPFVRLANSLSILNGGKLDESLRLDFPEDKFRIDVGPDHIILLADGEYPLPLLAHPTSPGKVIFEILERLRKEETFGNFRHLVLLMECLVETDAEKEDVVDLLHRSYLNPNLLNTRTSPRTFDLNFGFNDGDGFTNLHVAYFDSSVLGNNTTDLFTFSPERALNMIANKPNSILLGHTKLEKNLTKVDLRHFRELAHEGFEHLKSALAHVKF